jgi:hypothetical protein
LQTIVHATTPLTVGVASAVVVTSSLSTMDTIKKGWQNTQKFHQNSKHNFICTMYVYTLPLAIWILQLYAVNLPVTAKRRAITTLNSKDIREKTNDEMIKPSLPVCQSSSHVSAKRKMTNNYVPNELHKLTLL